MEVKGQKLPQSESRRPGCQSSPPPPQIWGEVPPWARRPGPAGSGPGPACGGPPALGRHSHGRARSITKGRAQGSLAAATLRTVPACGCPGPAPASVPPALGLGKGRAEGSPAAARLTGLACGGPGLACIFNGSIITRRPGLACIFNGSIINRSIIATRVEGPGQPQ